MIPSRFRAPLTGFLMAMFMSWFMSAIITAVNTGLSVGFVGRWLQAWLLAWPLAFIAITVFRPIAARLAVMMTSPDAPEESTAVELNN
jgi:membrane protein implicated in regulation of membrane protease activity